MLEPIAQPEHATPGVSKDVLRTLLAIHRRPPGEASLEQALRSLLEAGLVLTAGSHGYLLVALQDGRRLELRAGDSDMALGRSLVHLALQAGRTLTGDEAALGSDSLAIQGARDPGSCSMLCVPFVSAAGVEGAFYVEHPRGIGTFGQQEREHLEELGNQAAIAIDRMLHEEEAARELAESRRDLAVVGRTARRHARRIVGHSQVMLDLLRQADKVAASDLSVLLRGPPGSGKESIACRIHERSARARRPFVAESCASLPQEMMESELFGHARGALPGADEGRPGLLELASGGTLFLDAIDALPLQLQPKLLRALQEGTIRRVGGGEKVAVDLRLVAATRKDLRQRSAEGHFREDLHVRIAAVQLSIPPLSERGQDVVLLAEELLDRLNRQHQRAVTLGKEAKRALLVYRWPGNVRELEHVLARSYLLLDGDELSDLHLPVPPPPPPAEVRTAEGEAWPVITLAEAEARTIRSALTHTRGDKTAAAKLLRISRTSLYEKLKRNGG